MPGTHRHGCGRKGGAPIATGLGVEATSFRERVRPVVGRKDRQDKQEVIAKAWEQSFDLGASTALLFLWRLT